MKMVFNFITFPTSKNEYNLRVPNGNSDRLVGAGCTAFAQTKPDATSMGKPAGAETEPCLPKDSPPQKRGSSAARLNACARKLIGCGQ